MSYRKLEDLTVELELTANLRPIGDSSATRPTIRHLFEKRELDAINAALAAGRPLLVRGEPGSGKSQLARAAARGLGRAFVAKVIDARTEARDLLWTFDAVRRLADAQVLAARGEKMSSAAIERALDELRYVTPGPLWWAFDWRSALAPAAGIDVAPPPQAAGAAAENGVVVLLDEIDKADSSVPNGLLDALGQGGFDGPARLRIECGAVPPLVVVTTNEERSLPDAFLRRCLVLQLKLYEDSASLIEWLKRRGRAHFKAEELGDSVLAQAAKMLARDRERLSSQGLPPPGAAEYLDLLRAVARSQRPAEEHLKLLERIGEFALRKHPEDAGE
jgi:MoxR-like ATPase